MSSNIRQPNEDLIKDNLKNLVRNSVEETLNALLDHEANELVRAGKYERTGDRKGYRFGHYERNFSTTSGEVRLRMPKLKGIQFETAIIERYKRCECSVEEALIEMYLAGVSVRRVEDITETLWGAEVSSGTISNLNQKAYKHIEEWRQRPLTGEYPYVYVDGMYLKRYWGGEIQNVSILVTIGVNKDGFRDSVLSNIFRKYMNPDVNKLVEKIIDSKAIKVLHIHILLGTSLRADDMTKPCAYHYECTLAVRKCANDTRTATNLTI